MTHIPLVRYPHRCILLPPQYAGSVGYYGLMAQYGHAYIATEMPYDKRRKSVHRTDIAGTNGRQSLTVPVNRPHGCQIWNQVTASPHNQWWNEHITALESAYGRTPFFEFYIPYLKDIISEKAVGRPVTDIDADIDAHVRRWLGLSTVMHNTIPQDIPTDNFPSVTLPDNYTRPYWQIRAPRLGFLPGLSVLDLLSNLGPEAPLYYETR